MRQPLILLPGIGSDAEVWADMPAGTVPAMTAESIDAMAAEVLATAPPRFALAGHSMGGYVALAVMAAAPERVTRLALLSTAASADSPQQAANRSKTIAAMEGDFAAVVPTLASALIGPDSPDRAALVDRAAAMLHRVGRDTVLRQQRATLARPDRLALLPTIAVPVLILTGEADAIVPPDRSATMTQAIRGSRLVTLPGCGHMPTWEHPAPTRDALLAWLAA